MPSTMRAAVALALTLPVGSGCALVSDFEQEGGAGGGSSASTGSGTTAATSGSTGSNATTGTDASTATSAGGGASTSSGGGSSVSSGPGGGEGGAPACPGVDLTSDEENCGACEFGCGSAECVDGQCGEVLQLDTGFGITSLRVDGDLLYLAQRTAQGNELADFVGIIRVLPIDFTATSVPTLDYPIANAIGGLERGTVGDRHVYFTGQVSLDPGEDANPYLLSPVYACDPEGCDPFYLAGTGGQIQSMLPVGDSLYQLLLAGWALASVPLDGSGLLSSSSPVPLVTAYSDPGSYNDGVLVLKSTPDPARLYWSSFCVLGETDCCIYRVDIDDLGSSPPATCWSEGFEARGFLVTPEGVVYAQERDSTLLKIEGDPPKSEVFATNVDHPRDLDADFLYAADGTTGAIRALSLDDGAEVARSEAPLQGSYAIDATHPDYVFYAGGNSLYRWPKPRPR